MADNVKVTQRELVLQKRYKSDNPCSEFMWEDDTKYSDTEEGWKVAHRKRDVFAGAFKNTREYRLLSRVLTEEVID